MSAKIGVIVPVYGTEKYISACIESILEQTYTNFRLILVDDATPDNAGAICDEYAQKDSRISVLHQENTGVNRARANGVALADDCDFITFVDSDDTITKDALSIMISAMTPDADIVISHRVVSDPFYKAIDKDEMTAKEFRVSILHKKISPAPWSKLFRKSLFNDYVFDIPREIVVGEDFIMNIRLSHNASGVIKVIHSDIYNYNVYDENTTKKFQSTPDFEFMWHRLIADSVIDQEEKEKYIRFSLRRRFYKYASFGGLEIDNKALMATDFYKELKHDIRLYKYHLSIRKSILFYSTNVHVRTFVVKTKTFITKIKEWFKKPKPAK